MKPLIIIFALLILAGCDLVKPLPGNDSITVGKEGFGVDKLVDNIINKTKKIKKDIENFKKTGELKTTDEEIDNKIKVIKKRAVLLDVADSGGGGKGFAEYKDGQFTLVITAELPTPKDEYFYKGWLVRDDPFKYISAGKLTKETDGKYHLKFIVNNDYADYDKIMITSEPNNDNKKPAAPVLKGIFKLITNNE